MAEWTHRTASEEHVLALVDYHPQNTALFLIQSHQIGFFLVPA